MKIVCDSCSAKYSIADEKVAGRVFKIRCKKCGAAIVVRGDQIDVGGGASETEEASTRVVDYGGDAVWHIVVDGEQQGPFAPAQLGEMLSAGTIGWDAFVWREGFDDWKPAQDIEDLVQAIMGGGQGADASSAASAGAEQTGADPFAATQHGAGAEPDGGVFGAQPAAIAARNDDAGADLFAQTDTASPFGTSGDEEDDVVASAPSPRVSADQALTGARNENSVLFSLSNLQALATGPGGGGATSSSASSSVPSASPKPGMAQGEGSGLIDIRALASATGMAPGSGGPVTSASTDNKVDDLLSIGGTGAGGLGSSLGAPVLIPEKKQESNKAVIVAVAAAAVALVAVVGAAAVVMTGGDSGETPVAAAGTVAPGQTVTAAGADTTPPAPADPAPAAEPVAQAAGAAIPEPAAEQAPEEEAETEADDDDTARATKARRRGRRQPASTSGGGGSSAPARAAAAPASSRRGGGGGDIDDLLNSAIGGGGGGGGGSARSSGGSSSGPQTPSRAAVVSAMDGVKGAVRACGNGASGMATVRVSFAGSNGRATSANVTGSLPGPVKSCISRAVRQASVPPFQQASFSITYPFPL